MFPYKFAAHSQKNDTNQVGGSFINPFKRSNLGVISSTTLPENTPKMVFDSGLSQSLSSPTPPRNHSKRSVKSDAHGLDLDSLGETQSKEGVIGSMTACLQHIQQLTNEHAQQVCKPTYSSTAIFDCYSSSALPEHTA